jgi:hypothetical protein
VSNSQRRTAWRHRRKKNPGLHTPKVQAAQSEVRQMGKRLMGVARMRKAVLEEQATEARHNRPIPTSGSGRRRAKALRNQAAVYERWPELRPLPIGTVESLRS